MAGVKGKSGGARPNSGGTRPGAGGARPNSGGARPGAGRKPKPKPEVAPPPVPPAVVEPKTPLEYLLSVQNDQLSTPALRLRAAIAAAQYVHTKKGDGGKKEDAADAAKKAGTGKFKPGAAPLRVVGGK